MARRCMVTGTKTEFGNTVSHSKRRVRRTFKANVHWKRFWVASQKKWVRLLVCNKGMKTIDKLGIEHVITSLLLK